LLLTDLSTTDKTNKRSLGDVSRKGTWLAGNSSEEKPIVSSGNTRRATS